MRGGFGWEPHADADARDVVVFLGTLNDQLLICKYSASGQLLTATGCTNLAPAFQWIDHCIISIFLVFMIAFKVICNDTYSNKSWSIVSQACSPSGR